MSQDNLAENDDLEPLVKDYAERDAAWSEVSYMISIHLPQFDLRSARYGFRRGWEYCKIYRDKNPIIMPVSGSDLFDAGFESGVTQGVIQERKWWESRTGMKAQTLTTDLEKLKKDQPKEQHGPDCDCGGFDRNGSHNAGEYVGYCLQRRMSYNMPFREEGHRGPSESPPDMPLTAGPISSVPSLDNNTYWCDECQMKTRGSCCLNGFCGVGMENRAAMEKNYGEELARDLYYANINNNTSLPWESAHPDLKDCWRRIAESILSKWEVIKKHA